MAILGRAGLAGAAALLATVALVPLLRSPSGGDTVAPATTTMAAAEPVAAVPGVVVPAPITAPAAVTVPADRLEGPQPVSTCQQIAYNVAKANPGTTQVIVVLTATAASTTGTLQVADLGAQGWQCGAAMTARVGRSGVRPLLDRRSGDGTTPAGVFPLGRMTAWDGQQFSFFGNAADPGVSAGPYRRVQYGDCFGATPNHPDYGHLVYRTPGNCPGPDDEYLPAITGAYVHAALIGANMEPDVSGDAGRDAVRCGDLPPPPLLRRQRREQADVRLRVAVPDQPGERAAGHAAGRDVRHRPDGLAPGEHLTPGTRRRGRASSPCS